MSTISTFQNVAVVGLGESGIAVSRLLASEGSRVTVYDAADRVKLVGRISELSAEGIDVRCGEEVRMIHGQPEVAILSPGIDPESALVQMFVSAGIPITGEMEVAYLRCKCPVVAITGTNGKTTTTQLVDAMFRAAGVPSVACGNISPAISAKVKESENLGVMTVEVSSFQLETISTFKPQVSVWLNFAPDHLDRYRSEEEYRAAKLRIFENQGNEQWAVVNGRDSLPALKSKVLSFSAYEQGYDFELVDGWIVFRGEKILRMADTKLRGLHNAENLMAALGVGFAWGLAWKEMLGALCEYEALPHRCEVVANFNGVEYVNDSKATNLDAMEKALQSETRSVVLIAGGKDKGFEFDAVKELVAARCRAAVLIGEMAGRIENLWGTALPCHRSGSLKEAVKAASEIAQHGDVVLFSPGTSSFDMFLSYADRGNQFRQAVRELEAATKVLHTNY